jgi:hypothetical protein
MATVLLDKTFMRIILDLLTLIDDEYAIADLLDIVHVVASKNQGCAQGLANLTKETTNRPLGQNV